MIEALTSILNFLANVWFDVIGFFSNLFEEKNYIALAAILVGCFIIGAIIGILKRKHTRKF